MSRESFMQQLVSEGWDPTIAEERANVAYAKSHQSGGSSRRKSRFGPSFTPPQYVIDAWTKQFVDENATTRTECILEKIDKSRIVLSEVDIEEILNMRRSGKTVKEISSSKHIHYNRVNKIIKDMGEQ